MQSVFRAVLEHHEPIVLKRQLLPLCLGHVYTLMVADSAYTSGGDTRTLLDLALAVGVCSRPFEDGAAWLRSQDLIEDANKWGKTCRRLSFADEAAKFDAYLEAASKAPERWQKHRGSVLTSGCRHPWPLITAIRIMPLVGESRAWNMPISLALSMSSALSEIEGDDSLMSDAEIQIIEEAKAKSGAA